MSTQCKVGGNNLGKGFEWNTSMTLKNYWNIYAGGNLSGSYISTSMLRGGPMIILPGNGNGRTRLFNGLP